MIDIEVAAVESGIVPKGDVAGFLKALRKRDFSWLVTDASTEEPRLQGDILTDVPVSAVRSDSTPMLRTGQVMVLNPICDLQPGRSQFLVVAPLVSFAKVAANELRRSGEEKAKSFLENVRANNVDELFYLPTCPPLREDALVYLGQLCSVHAEVYERALAGNHRSASLTHNGYYFLLMKLSRLFIRPQ